MPPSIRNRAADNWRVLLSIADALGHSNDARAAAVELYGNRPDEDPGVVLLQDIQTVFLAREIDRISSAELVEALVNLDDGIWHDWRGPNDDRPPRKLTPGELSRLLRPFDIRPRTIWPPQRQSGAKSRRGYLRSQFEAAWRAYCSSADTATQPSKIMRLVGS
jgi:putative DNA primase/helicase